jgi:hypothetical protein
MAFSEQLKNVQDECIGAAKASADRLLLLHKQCKTNAGQQFIEDMVSHLSAAMICFPRLFSEAAVVAGQLQHQNLKEDVM